MSLKGASVDELAGASLTIKTPRGVVVAAVRCL